MSSDMRSVPYWNCGVSGLQKSNSSIILYMWPTLMCCSTQPGCPGPEKPCPASCDCSLEVVWRAAGRCCTGAGRRRTWQRRLDRRRRDGTSSAWLREARSSCASQSIAAPSSIDSRQNLPGLLRTKRTTPLLCSKLSSLAHEIEPGTFHPGQPTFHTMDFRAVAHWLDMAPVHFALFRCCYSGVLICICGSFTEALQQI